MKKSLEYILIAIIIVIVNYPVSANENGNSGVKTPMNNFNLYVSLFEFNINYERSIFQGRNSNTNLRTGFGLAAFNAWDGYYFNAALVHLTGKKSSHLELNLGLKYVIEEGASNSFMPDVLVGYRYEKPSGGLIFRAGIGLYTLWNVGIGFKF